MKDHSKGDIGEDSKRNVVLNRYYLSSRLSARGSSRKEGRLNTLPFAVHSAIPHMFCNEQSLELGNRSNHLEHEFASWQRVINSLRQGNKIGPKCSSHTKRFANPASHAIVNDLPGRADLVGGQPRTPVEIAIEPGLEGALRWLRLLLARRLPFGNDVGVQ